MLSVIIACRQHDEDVLACMLPMLRTAGTGPGTSLAELARDCERRLTAIAERPARADDDWSVRWPGGCGCDLCGTFSGFLTDCGKRTLEWPLAEARRKHRSEEHTSELQSRFDLVCRLLLEK